jgi:hypothetical protein
MHVQVVTRFVAAACPALYWFLAYTWLAASGGSGSRPSMPRGASGAKLSWLAAVGANATDVRFWVLAWCVGYTVAGCLLFPNFLPWT